METRFKVNLLSFLVTVGVLFVAIKVSGGTFATRINKISENLDRALNAIIEQGKANFTEITDDASYVSKSVFNPRGMAGLYNFTTLFMDLLLYKDIYPEGFLKIDGNRPVIGSLEEQWKGLLGKYAGLLTMIVILGVIIVLFPLCGLCFCCCRCCGKCGARSQPFDKKHDLCKKIVLATMLICLGTLLLFGVVCAFVSNEQMQEGVNELSDNLRKGVKDVNSYLDSTNKQVNVLLRINYVEFEGALLTTINESNDIVYNELADYSNATSMTELASVVKKLPAIKEGFDTLKYSTNSLRNYASQLNDAVRKVKKDLLQTLKLCTLKKCEDINKNISLLQTNIHFNNLPDISAQITILEGLDQDVFQRAVEKGNKNLEKIRSQIGEAVNTTLDQARAQIRLAGVEIEKGSQNITAFISDIKSRVDVNTKQPLNTLETYVKKYGPYRYYVALAISCVLLLIAVCIALGLVCGICGKRPDVYADDCCNKGAGSQFLICGVMLMFLTGIVIAAVVLVAFLTGMATQRIVCDPLRAPGNSSVFRLIDQIDFSGFDIDFKISRALADCYRNKSVYEVFQLHNKFNLEDVENYLEKFQINEILSKLDVSNIDFDGFEILGPDETAILKNLGDKGFDDVKFGNFQEILEFNFTTVNLTTISDELGDVIERIKEDDDQSDILTELQLSKMNIETYQEKIVTPMIENATQVVKLAKQLEQDLKLGHNSFKEAIDALCTEVEEAENTLKNTGKEQLKNIIVNFTSGIIDQIKVYLLRISSKTRSEVGQCGPLSLVVNSTLTSTCDKIILPWNGFWFGLFWSLLIFIPTIFVSVKLATLYQKFNPYSGHLVESEYLYDAYAERESIPLNSRGSKGKKKNKKYKRYEDRPIPTAGTDVVSREFPGGSHQDARYADMAPKHWEEFPSGGPPQYQRAPTEYERPPPYYYPGAGENQ